MLMVKFIKLFFRTFNRVIHLYIVVGSTNPTKVRAIKQLFPENAIQSISAPSMVTEQPFSDEETMEGAVNRANYAVNKVERATIGIGLEGGVTILKNELYLCNWGALVTKDNKVFVASGAKILLPNTISKRLQHGEELGDIMADLTVDENVRTKAGAIGILTKGRINRQNMYAHIGELLFGQYEYSMNNKSRE